MLYYIAPRLNPTFMMFTTSQFNFASLLNLHDLVDCSTHTILELLVVLEVTDTYLIMCYICDCLKCVTNRIAAFYHTLPMTTKKFRFWLILNQADIYKRRVEVKNNERKFTSDIWNRLSSTKDLSWPILPFILPEMAHLVSSGDGLVVTVDRESGRERCVVFRMWIFLFSMCVETV